MTSLLVLLVLSQVPSGRACVANFTEAGAWGSGKSFRTHLEVEGVSRDQAFQAAAQMIATEGYLGLSANNDIGVVSAYQENNGKRSSINVVVSEPGPGRVRVEAVFQLAPGLRSPSGAVRDLLCKYVESVLPADQRDAMKKAGGGELLLRTTGGDLPLEWKGGSQRQAGGGLALLFFLDYSGEKAEKRATGPRPVVVVRMAENPEKKLSWVRLDADREENRRSMKLGSAGQIAKVAVTGKADLRPDKDWTVPFSAEEKSPGLWELTPKRDLEAGEYGLWDLEGMALADFGVGE